MRLWLIALGCAAGACGSSSTKAVHTTTAKLRPTCDAKHDWNGTACTPRLAVAKDLKTVSTAMASFDLDKAVPVLNRLRKLSPHRHNTLVTIYEQLGIAAAWKHRPAEAVELFDQLLALSPGHVLSYHLTTRVTRSFSKARTKARKRGAPTLNVTWPRKLKTTTPVPVALKVVADPRGFLNRAAIYVRRKGADKFQRVDVRLPKVGGSRRVVLPALSSKKPETLQLFVTAFDRRGNEVLKWWSAERPREIDLDYRKPQRWYRKWWVWAIAGGVVATGTGTAVYLIGREPPDTVDGGLDITR